MKKLISLVLVAVLVFSFAACNNDKNGDSTTTTESTTVELDIEQLKYNWTDGVLNFENGKQATIPNTVNQFLESSGLVFANYDVMANVILKPGESKTVYFSGANMYVNIKCKNLTTEDTKLIDTTVIGYSFNNTNTGNKAIKFANTLTVGIGKADVEEALGSPTKTAGENSLYFYNGRNAQRKKVELRISFNSDGIVNSVAFEIDA